jgi:hypothetical protein
MHCTYTDKNGRKRQTRSINSGVDKEKNEEDMGR